MNAWGVQRTIMALFIGSEFEIESNFILLAGLILGIFGLTKAIGNYVAGRLSTRFQVKKLIALAAFILLIGSFILYLWQTLFWIVIGNTLLGLAIGLLIASSMIALSTQAGSFHQAKIMSIMEICVYLGTSVGAMLTRVNPNDFKFTYLLSFLTILPIVVLILIILKSKSKVLKRAEKTISPTKFKKKLHKKLVDIVPDNINADKLSDNFHITNPSLIHPTSFQSKGITRLLAYQVAMISRISDSVIILVFPLFVNEMQLSEHLAVLSSSFTIFWGLGIVLSGSIADNVGRKMPMIVGLMMEWFGYVIFLIPEINGTFIALLIGIVIAGLGRGIYYPIPATLIADLSSERKRGQQIGRFRFIMDGSYFLGAGIIIAAIEPLARANEGLTPEILRIGFIIILIFILIMLALLLFFLRDPRPGFKQINIISKHAKEVNKSMQLICMPYMLNRKTPKNMIEEYKIAKASEQKADLLLEEITGKTYTGAYPANDAFEMLSIARKVDRAVGHILRSHRKVTHLKSAIPEKLKEGVGVYMSFLLVLMDFLIDALLLLPKNIGEASVASYYVNIIEAYLDGLHIELWEIVMHLTSEMESWDLILILEFLEGLEKSANTLEDAAEIIRLIRFKRGL